jgi:hypothetical protein
MNDHDKSNLIFLLNLSPQGFKEWFSQASEDDHTYAQELVEQARLMVVDAAVAKMPQYKEAEEVLKPFLL